MVTWGAGNDKASADYLQRLYFGFRKGPSFACTAQVG